MRNLKNNIDVPLSKIKPLPDIVERVCTAQIDYYSQQTAR